MGRREAKASGTQEGTKHSRLRGNKRMTEMEEEKEEERGRRGHCSTQQRASTPAEMFLQE